MGGAEAITSNQELQSLKKSKPNHESLSTREKKENIIT